MVLTTTRIATADPDTAPETLDERLESYAAALNYVARELTREADLLRSREAAAERQRRCRAAKRAQNDAPPTQRRVA